MIKTLIVLFFLNIANAGFKVGNGGHVIECNNKIELYDFYYIRNYWKENLPTLSNELNFSQIVDKEIEKLDTFFPHIAKEMRNRSKVKIVYSRISKPATTNDVASPYAIPQNCKLHQVAIQYKDIVRNETVIVIDTDLFAKLSEFDKAGLFLHELFYLSLGFESAQEVRILNYLTFWSKINNIEFILENPALFAMLNISEFKYYGIYLKINEQIRYDSFFNIESAQLSDKHNFEFLNFLVIPNEVRAIEFYQNHRIKEFSYRSLVGKEDYVVVNKVRIPISNKYGLVKFHDNGNIQSLNSLREIGMNRYDLPKYCENQRTVNFSHDGIFLNCSE